MARRGLFWFSNDLRLQDQVALRALSCRVDELVCVVCIDPALQQSRPEILGDAPISSSRRRFLEESVRDLADSLSRLGQRLLICRQPPVTALSELIEQLEIDDIVRSRHPGFYEQRQWQALQQRLPDCRFQEVDNRTLFSTDMLPFACQDLPGTFSRFRRAVEAIPVPRALPAPDYLPPPPPLAQAQEALIEQDTATTEPVSQPGFVGGEGAALNHLNQFFHSPWPSQYKALRNDLDDWDHSTKLSPWLALGCLSPRQVVAELKAYEAREGANESTYWIYFELLWREFFQWYAHQHGRRLFSFRGLRDHKPLTSFYPDRFRAWCEGSTPWPIVNACMKQLKQTGFMSNRGRQIVASCFVHELQLDWRYGAAYFEQQLIDYDMASNWGNWQYLAGVGADPRGHRHFDIDKQTRQFDPDGQYIRRWRGAEHCASLDNRDMVDWPISPGGQQS